jgi:hypothetical protein
MTNKSKKHLQQLCAYIIMLGNRNQWSMINGDAHLYLCEPTIDAHVCA